MTPNCAPTCHSLRRAILETVSLDLDATGRPNGASSAIEPATPTPRVSVPPPPLGRWLSVSLAVLFGTSLLGSTLVAKLSVDHPLLLIALSPLPRHIILVAGKTPMLALVTIATIRSLLSCIVAYEIGRHYGPRAVHLFEKRSPRMGGFVRGFERIFLRAAPLFLMLSPGPLTSMLAAVSGNRRATTWTISAVGLAIWASVNYKIGDWLRPYTGAVLAFFEQHLLPITIACIVLVLGYQWVARQRRLRKEREAHLQ